MTYRLVVVVLLIAAGLLFCRGPSAKKVVADTRIALGEGVIEYHGRRYTADWGETLSHQGDVRRIGRARYDFAPYFTHHAVVTTGEYSDPGRVAIGPFRGGSVMWTAATPPRGSLVVLHFLPADASVLSELARVDSGDCVRFSGREETDGHIQGEDGAYARLNSSNHRYFLLESVRACP